MKLLLRLCAVAALVGCFSATASADITIGDFEAGNITAEGWTGLGNASAVGPFLPTNPIAPFNGNFQGLMRSNAGSSTAAAVETALGLTAGQLGGAPAVSAMYNDFVSTGSSNLAFQWNFVTEENAGSVVANADRAFWSISLIGGPTVNANTLFTVSNANTTGLTAIPNPASNSNFKFQTGYAGVAQLGPVAAGTYRIGFGVADADGFANTSSVLLLDVVSVPEPSSLAVLGLGLPLLYRRRRS